MPVDSIIPKMLSSIKEIHALTYTLRNSERFGGELISGEFLVKYTSEPKRCYFYMIRPNEGSELIYVDGANRNRATYNPSGFPYFPVNLDPMGEVMRSQNHHTLYEAGFAYIGQIIDQVYKKDKDGFKLLGEIVWEGRSCYQVEMEFPGFGYVDYTAGKDETLRDVAKEHNLNEYKILELNPNIEKYNLIPQGERIRIPNCYAKRMELLIDQENFLPLHQRIFDDEGLFEIYEFIDLSLNPEIDEEEFDFKGSRKRK